MVRHAPDPIVAAICECCGATFTTHRPTPSRPITKYCSLLCYRLHKPKPVKQPITERECTHHCMIRARVAARRAEVGAVGTYTWAEITRLWINFGKRCAYCREVIPLTQVQAEHVVALNKGGSNSLTNMLPSCMYCNGDKRDLALDEWAADRARRGKPPVVTAWEASDPIYGHLTSVLGHQ